VTARRPNLVVVGAPKCGTSAIHDYLGRHPDVFMAPYKEPSYFCADLHRCADAFHGGRRYFAIRTEVDYLDVFGGARGERVVGESSPVYLGSDDAIRNLHAFDAAMRLVVLVRDPVELLHSWYYQLRATAHEDAPTFAEALRLEPERRAGRRVPRTAGCPAYLHYRRWGALGAQLERLLAVFPREQVAVLALDDLRREPQEALLRLHIFLGVAPRPERRFDVVNRTPEARLPWLRRLTRHPLVWEHVRPRLPVGALAMWQRLEQRLLLRRIRRPPLDAGVRARLRDELRPDVVRLSAAAGRDFVTEWGY